MEQPVLVDYITKKDLAAELGITERTLNRWAVLRFGPPVVHAGKKRTLYRRAGVLRWLERNEQWREKR